MLLDELQEVLLVEALHHDERPAQSNRSGGAHHRRRMVERGRHEIDLAIAKLPEFRKYVEDRKRLRGGLVGQRPKDALRVAGRARGIEHRPAEHFVGDGR